MLAVQGVCKNGQIELLEPIPREIRSSVAVVFLDVDEEQMKDAREAMLLAQSPTFARLVQRGLSELKRGNSRPVEDFLNELPD